MTVPPVVDRSLRQALELAALLAFLPPLVTRLLIGFAFHQTGNGKLENFENTVSFFTGLGIPFPEANVAFVARLEYYGGALLIVGLLTRVVALLLSSTMIVALWTAHKSEIAGALAGTSDAGLTDISALVFLCFLLWLVIYGPGGVSFDHLLFRKLGRDGTKAAQNP
jgi:putative oxidoreductase